MDKFKSKLGLILAVIYLMIPVLAYVLDRSGVLSQGGWIGFPIFSALAALPLGYIAAALNIEDFVIYGSFSTIVIIIYHLLVATIIYYLVMGLERIIKKPQ